MPDRFVGRTALITGAASGVGRATAMLLAAEGAQVFAVDINPEGIEETIEAIRKTGARAEGTVCNVADGASARAAIARAVAELGSLNILVNAAGVGRSCRLEDVEDDEWRRVMGVNLDGAFYTMKAAIPHLLTEGDGNIVNVASIAGLRGQAYNATYCASKAGLINLTRAIAVEFAKRGLRANCICPGGIATPFVRIFMPREDFESNLVAYYMPPVPHRLAQAEAVAKVIAFLASDDAAHINGSALVADDATLA